MSQREPVNGELDALMVKYAPFAEGVIHKLLSVVSTEADHECLRSAGFVGLWKSIVHHEPQKGAFFSYARTRIRGEILDELRRQCHVSRSVIEQQAVIEKKRAELEQLRGQEVDNQTLGDLMGLDEDSRFYLEHFTNTDHQPLCDWEAKSNEEFAPDHLSARLDDLRLLHEAMEECGERAKYVYRRYYVDGATGFEIAQELGVTESRICQIRCETESFIRYKFSKRFGLEPVPAYDAGSRRLSALARGRSRGPRRRDQPTPARGLDFPGRIVSPGTLPRASDGEDRITADSSDTVDSCPAIRALRADQDLPISWDEPLVL